MAELESPVAAMSVGLVGVTTIPLTESPVAAVSVGAPAVGVIVLEVSTVAAESVAAPATATTVLAVSPGRGIVSRQGNGCDSGVDRAPDKSPVAALSVPAETMSPVAKSPVTAHRSPRGARLKQLGSSY